MSTASDLDADPYRLQRVDERREARLARVKESLRAKAGKGAGRGKAGREPVTSVAKVESDRDRKNSRVKGSRGELDVAQMFSRWSGEVVRRTPQSGGWSNARFGVTADLVCANKAFPFHVEVKHREGWVLDDLVTGNRREHDKSIVQWWKQCVGSCPVLKGKKGGALFQKKPLLVFRRNRQPWLVMMRWVECVHEDAAKFTLPYAMVPDVSVMPLAVFLDLEPVPKGLRNHDVSP